MLSAAAMLLSACGAGYHEGLEDGEFDEFVDEDSLVDQDGVVLGTAEQEFSYPTCMYPWSDPDGDGWGWEFYQTCKVATSGGGSSEGGSSGGGSSGGGNTANCQNPEGTASTMAALAVAAAMELKRWQPTKDFAIGRVDGQEGLVLTHTGRSRCSDGVCFNTQALLDFQKNSADGQIMFPNNVKLNSPALRSRMVAKFRDQQACEMQPSNGGTTNCPVEEHTLTFQRSEQGGCDTNYFFVAKKPDGSALRYPGQLKNKLKWADTHNPYVGFQNVGEVVSIDPTYGLNQSGSTSTGSCTAACVKVSSSNVSGQCCTCGGRTKKYSRSPWNASTYLCR